MHVAAVLAFAASFASAAPRSDDFSPVRPSHDAARRNAHLIFNEIHSAARQWGSSLNHNGMGFIPAVIPKGTLLHHGSHEKATPEVPDWLAFEVEHAEHFATSRRERNPKDEDDKDPRNSKKSSKRTQKPLNAATSPPLAFMRGYLHVYQARRDLQLLYLDGLAAAKTKMGTLDSQDYVLRTDAEDSGLYDEWKRAKDMCDTVTAWGYDGLIRTEIGFEVIHCNFTDSLDLVSRTTTAIGEDKMTDHGLWQFDFARAASRRYDGLGAGRVRLDYSSLVSGFFFPMNISSQTPDRPDLLRLSSARKDERESLREAIREAAILPRKCTVDWQGVVDQIVARFSDRFTLLTAEEGVTDETFRDELESMALTYYDAPPLPNDRDAKLETSEADEERRQEEAVDWCSKYFLLPALVFKEDFSVWDDMIHTAIAEVTHTICKTTQRTWVQLNQTTARTAPGDGGENGTRLSQELVRRTDATALRQGVQVARSAIRDLMDQLAWTVWKQTRPCPPNAFVYVAMWPFGTPKDHWEPGCRSVDDLRRPENWFGYWDDGRKRG